MNKIKRNATRVMACTLAAVTTLAPAATYAENTMISGGTASIQSFVLEETTVVLDNLISFIGMFDGNLYGDSFFEEGEIKEEYNLPENDYASFTLEKHLVYIGNINDIASEGSISVNYGGDYMIGFDSYLLDDIQEGDIMLDKLPAHIYIYKVTYKETDTEVINMDRLNELLATIPDDYADAEGIEKINTKVEAAILCKTQEEFDARMEEFEIMLSELLAVHGAKSYEDADILYKSTTYAGLSDEERALVDAAYQDMNRNFTDILEIDLEYEKLEAVIMNVYGIAEDDMCDYSEAVKHMEHVESYMRLYEMYGYEDEVCDVITYIDWRKGDDTSGENQTDLNLYISGVKDKVAKIENEILMQIDEEVNSLINEFHTMTEENYGAEEYAMVKAYVQTINLEEENLEKQDNVLSELITLMKSLKASCNVSADYTKVEKYVELYQTLEPAFYTEESWNEFKNAVESVIYDLNAESQDTVELMVESLKNAYEGLVSLKADYTALNEQMERVPEDLSIYQESSVNALNSVLNAIQWDLTADRQEDVDSWAIQLRARINLLRLKAGDYSVIQEIKDSVGDVSYYTEDSVADYEEALNEVQYGLDITYQEEIDAMAEKLQVAADKLVALHADYTELNRVLESVPDLNLYTVDSQKYLNKCLENIDLTLTAKEQDKVDKMVKDIKEAMDLLMLKDADYTALKEQMSSVPDEMSYYYTEETVAIVEAAIEAVEEGLDILQQNRVDKMTEDLKTAIDNLVEYPADYSGIEEDLNRIPENLGMYTEESVVELEDAIKGVVYGLGKTKQNEVNKMDVALNYAIINLQFRPAVFTELDAALERVPKDYKLYYTDETVEVLDAALARVDRSLTIDKQGTVTILTKEINDAIDGLIALPADYTWLWDVVASQPDDLSIYTDESIAVYEETVATLDFELTIFEQNKVDKMAEDLEKAIDGLTMSVIEYKTDVKAMENIVEDVALKLGEAVKEVLKSEHVEFLYFDVNLMSNKDGKGWETVLENKEDVLHDILFPYPEVEDVCTYKYAVAHYLKDGTVETLNVSLEEMGVLVKTYEFSPFVLGYTENNVVVTPTPEITPTPEVTPTPEEQPTVTPELEEDEKKPEKETEDDNDKPVPTGDIAVWPLLATAISGLLVVIGSVFMLFRKKKG